MADAPCSTPTDPLASCRTVADLLEHLGGIPADRVWLRPAPGTATERDVIEADARADRLCELVDGVLVEKAEGAFETWFGGFLLESLVGFVKQNGLGIVVTSRAPVRLAPGLVRMPSMAYISWDRMPGRRIPREPITDVVPDLVVEVLRRGNTAREMERKLREWFAAGVRLAWTVDPHARTVLVHTAADRSVWLDEGQELGGRDVLPGFHLAVRDWFAEMER
jgi:Uma2 family endonuclease